MAVINMSSPWICFYHEVEAFFKYDPQVSVLFDDESKKIKLYVEDSVKADALSRLMVSKKEFGNVNVTIEVIPANTRMASAPGSLRELYEDALKGNGAFSFAKTVSGVFTNNINYIVFRNRVVQFFNDDLGDIYGQCSTLYQYIAEDIFSEIEGVFYCTDKPDVAECVSVPPRWSK